MQGTAALVWRRLSMMGVRRNEGLYIREEAGCVGRTAQLNFRCPLAQRN